MGPTARSIPGSAGGSRTRKHGNGSRPARATRSASTWRRRRRRQARLPGTTRERGRTEAHPEIFGDVVLARKDTPTSYHFAVTVDDHFQGITLVTRGEDLLPATHVHRLLQALLGLETPEYLHHSLMTDDEGRRLAKRHDSLSIRSLRERGHTAEEVRAMAGFGKA